MNLQHLETVIPVSAAVQQGCERIEALAWGRSDDKLAVCRNDRVIYLYDEKGGLRDKFQTRAKDPSEGNGQSYTVTCMAFSPDSTKLAVGQSDLIVYVYKIGEEFKMKKSIIHKFQQPAPVTSIAWPKENEIFCGLLDGKIRQCHTVSRKGPKTRTVMSNESCNIALVTNVWGTEMIASFTDFKIAVFEIGDEDMITLLTMIKHSCPPTSIAITNDAVLAGGHDKKLTIYDKRSGEVKQLFDYSLSNEEREFSCAAANPEGKSVVVGSYNKLFVYHYVPRRKEWSEGPCQDFDSLYMVSTIQWRRDGSCLAVANNIGALYLIEATYKRTRHERFEMIYSSPSSIILNIFEPQKSVQIKSRYACEILEAKLSKDGNYAIVKTGDTLILAEVASGLTSEIPWLYQEKDKERFYFEYENVCVIYFEGELTVVEYGRDETLGSYRVDGMNTHVLSIRVTKKLGGNGEQAINKKLAYLVDPRTITIVDLQYNLTVGNVAHDTKIDWLELNESGSKLLFRDKRSRLYLYGVDSSNKFPLVMSCEFVQWVPGCDVVVVQTNGLLRVWYNLETPDVTVDHEVNGNALQVYKKSERDPTVVTFEDGSSQHELTLDEGRIQFATALESGNLFQAVWHLENYDMTPEVLAMWQRLAKVSLENYEMRIAQKAYSVLGDVPRAKFLFNTIEMIRGPGDSPQEWYSPGWWKEHQMCIARRNILLGRIKEAEVVFIRHMDVDNALGMYKVLQRWDEAITLAKVKNHPQLNELLQEFTSMVYRDREWYEAGKFFESVAMYNHSIFHYLESGFPTHAARCVSKSKMKLDDDLMERLGNTLVDMRFYETAGDFFKTTGQRGRSLDAYRKGRCFEKALRLAKRYYPNEVTNIEEEWGDWKFSLRDIDSAGYHYIEAGNLFKAVECALESRQWKKASQIISGMKDDGSGSLIQYWIRLGDCYAAEEEFGDAEQCYLKGNVGKKAIDMYALHEKWDDAVRVANAGNYSREEMKKDYIQYAQKFMEEEKYPQAEKLLIAMEEIDQCIGMYAKAKMYDQVLRIVKEHHPSHLDKTAAHVAELFLKEGDIKSAVSTFLACGLWQNVVGLYQERGLFADAHQTASQYGGSKAATYVVFSWAATLQADAGVKLLNKYNCFDEAIAHYNSHGNLELSAELCRVGNNGKLQEILYQMAMHAEQKGDLDEAAKHYLEGGMNYEAIEMYLRRELFDTAMEVAKRTSKEAMQKVMIAQAEQMFYQRNFVAMENLLLRAEKPEHSVNLYKRANMWNEAFRVCKDNCPQFMEQLQREFDRSDAKLTMHNDAESIIEQAKRYEKLGEYKRAVECYLQLTPDMMDGNPGALAKCWMRGGELAIKFLKRTQAEYVVQTVAPLLMAINMHMEAANLYGLLGFKELAVETLIAGKLWEEAKDLAGEVSPEMERYVTDQQTKLLKQVGQVDELENLNLTAALDLLCEQGQWKKCMEKAKRQGGHVFSSYLAKYVTHLLKHNQLEDAMGVYGEYGPPADKLHYALYKAIAMLIFGNQQYDKLEVWTRLRDILFDVMNGMKVTPDAASKYKVQLERILWCAHYYVNRVAFSKAPGMESLAAKISISLLRYIGTIPAEKAFYEAGQACRDCDWKNMAFVFLNHFMDIYDAIEDGMGNTVDLDNTDFLNTDIPLEVELPGQHMVPRQGYDDAREWILAASMDPDIQQSLRLDERGVFEASLVPGPNGMSCDQCLLSGYPVLGPRVSFRVNNRAANREDWNKLVMSVKSTHNPELQNIVEFINDWCGANPNYIF